MGLGDFIDLTCSAFSRATVAVVVARRCNMFSLYFWGESLRVCVVGECGVGVLGGGVV